MNDQKNVCSLLVDEIHCNGNYMPVVYLCVYMVCILGGCWSSPSTVFETVSLVCYYILQAIWPYDSGDFPFPIPSPHRNSEIWPLNRSDLLWVLDVHTQNTIPALQVPYPLKHIFTPSFFPVYSVMKPLVP